MRISYLITKLRRFGVPRKCNVLSSRKRVSVVIRVLAVIILLYVTQLIYCCYDCFKIVSVERVSVFPRRMRILGRAFIIWKKPIYCHYLIGHKSLTVTNTKSAWKYLIRFSVDCPVPQDLPISSDVRVSLSHSQSDPGSQYFDITCILTRQQAPPPDALHSIGPSLPLLRVTEAYVHMASPRMVRFVAVGRVISAKNLFCHFRHNEKIERTQATLQLVMGSYKLEFDGCFILCPVPASIQHLQPSTRISLSQAKNNPGPNWFQLTWIPDRPPDAPTIALCLAPIHEKVSVSRMVAWIEMNRLLGVSHFMMYDFDMDPGLTKLMAYYRKKGIVSLLIWNTGPIPVKKYGVWPPPPHMLHYFGQFASNNDCLYRLGNRFRYLMFTDLDEMIVPLRNTRLIDYLQSVDNGTIAQFRFRNTYVRDDYPKDDTVRRIDPELADLKVPFLDFTRREKRVLPANLGQKVIVKFENSHVMSVHELSLNSKGTFDVPVRDALLFHYRTPPAYLNFSDVGETSLRLRKLVPPLISRIRQVLMDLNI